MKGKKKLRDELCARQTFPFSRNIRKTVRTASLKLNSPLSLFLSLSDYNSFLSSYIVPTYIHTYKATQIELLIGEKEVEARNDWLCKSKNTRAKLASRVRGERVIAGVYQRGDFIESATTISRSFKRRGKRDKSLMICVHNKCDVEI